MKGIFISLLIGAIAVATPCALFAGHTAPSPAGAEAAGLFDPDIVNNTLAISPDQRIAAVAYSPDRGVRVYDLKSGNILATLDQFPAPRNILFTPDSKFILVSDGTRGEIAIVDAQTLRETGALAVGPGAFGTILSKDGTRLYVNNEAANTVTVFDLPSRRALAVISGFAQPRQGIRLSPDEKTLFVTNFEGDKITLVDAQTFKIIGEITGFKGIRAISITSDGKTLYAAESFKNAVAVTDIPSRTIITEIPVGKDPYGAALSPDGKRVYSGDKLDNDLTVIDTATLKVVGHVTGLSEPRQAIVFSPDGKTAYVLNKDLSVAVVDLDADAITRTIGGAQNSAVPAAAH